MPGPFPTYHVMVAPASRTPPRCPYCGNRAVLMSSRAVYFGRDYGPIWCCWPCQAWVGTHKDSTTYAPLGRLANGPLRKLKMKVHGLFDPCWKRFGPKGKGKVRQRAYKLLAEAMGIPAPECHVAEFDEERCQKAITVLKSERWRVLAATLTTEESKCNS